MNKKILMSIAAAATMATVFTGCGSDSSSSDDSSTVSGVAVKANLNGANVTMGGTSVKTDENGSFTVSGTGSTVTITDGNYTKDGVVKTNTATLTATKTQIDAGVEASFLTMLIAKFGGDDSATEKAFNLLGLDYVEGVDLATQKAASFEQAALSIASVIEATKGDTTKLNDLFETLETNATSKKIAADLTATLKSAAASAGVNSSKLDAILTAIEEKKSFKFIVEKLETLEDNETAPDYNASAYMLPSSIDVNASDFNGTVATFKLFDNNASLDNANGNTSLFLTIQGIDAANLNSSYSMALSDLNISKSGDFITLTDVNTSKLSTLAVSTTKKAISEDINATMKKALVDQMLSATGETTSVNVDNFNSNMNSIYMESSDDENVTTPAYGSFTLPNGNYSVSVSVNVDDNVISENNKVNSIVGSNMMKKDSDGNKLFEGMTGYQVVDANLTK